MSEQAEPTLASVYDWAHAGMVRASGRSATEGEFWHGYATALLYTLKELERLRAAVEARRNAHRVSMTDQHCHQRADELTWLLGEPDKEAQA